MDCKFMPFMGGYKVKSNAWQKLCKDSKQIMSKYFVKP